jgi:hypothetical protein
MAQRNGIGQIELKNFDVQPHLPKYLLSRKSIVFMSVPRSATDPTIRADWKKLSQQVHAAFKKMKIDAVAYYQIDDLYGNSDATLSYSKEMIQREIKYIIIVEQSSSNAAGVTSFKITISGFNKKESFISDGQKAWQTEGPDLKVLLNGMRKEVFRAEMKLENYLIADGPEFFTDTKILKGKRIPTYAKDLKVDMLIVPRFEYYSIEDSTKLGKEALQKVVTYNLAIDKKNKKLEQIMGSYPWKYEFSNSSSDDEIYKRGYQFVLLPIYGSGRTIKELLNFEINPFETEYVTIKSTEFGTSLRRLPVDAVVTKYYVKHVHTQDAYIGSKWDADLTWEEALQNFIFLLKESVKKKKK